MGQLTNPSAPGITVLPIDRQTGPKAGPGNVGNLTLFLGANAGQNNTQPNVIALGNGAAAAGLVGANLGGSIILGVNAAAALKNDSLNVPGPNVIIGQSALATSIDAGTNVVIGDHAGATFTSPDAQLSSIYGNVLIGAQVMNAVQGVAVESVILGYLAGQQTVPPFGATFGSSKQNVTIGAFANSQTDQSGTSGLVVIGYQAGQNLRNSSTSVVAIGATTAKDATTDTNSVYVGGGILNPSGGATSFNTVIGDSARYSGKYNVTIGYLAYTNISQNQAGSVGNIVIGAGAGNALPLSAQNIFSLATDINGAQNYLLYGEIAKGNLYVGNSGANLDIGGLGVTNGLKIFNGGRGAGNPVGGGFLYSNAGALHWVDTGGNDNLLSLNSTGQLAASSVAYTNNVGAQLATIANGPTAGNPTKWIPINDNGTIRNVPAW